MKKLLIIITRIKGVDSIENNEFVSFWKGEKYKLIKEISTPKVRIVIFNGNLFFEQVSRILGKRSAFKNLSKSFFSDKKVLEQIDESNHQFICFLFHDNFYNNLWKTELKKRYGNKYLFVHSYTQPEKNDLFVSCANLIKTSVSESVELQNSFLELIKHHSLTPFIINQFKIVEEICNLPFNEKILTPLIEKIHKTPEILNLKIGQNAIPIISYLENNRDNMTKMEETALIVREKLISTKTKKQ